MKRKISILSLVFFVASLITPISAVNATEIINENSSINITESIDNSEEEITNGNKEDIKDISKLNDSLKKIIGVVDTSLFYNIATKALVVGENGVRLIENER